MNRKRVFSGSWLALWAALLAGCAQQPATSPELMTIEQRLNRLEGRVESLERRDALTPAIPTRSREEIEAHIRGLEAEREKLLLKYTPAHPSVRDIDRHLMQLRQQVELLRQGARPGR